MKTVYCCGSYTCNAVSLIIRVACQHAEMIFITNTQFSTALKYLTTVRFSLFGHVACPQHLGTALSEWTRPQYSSHRA